MKFFIRILLFIVLTLIGTGLYLKNIQHEKGEFITGIGVLTLAFILIPSFIYHRYKGKDISKYSFKNMQGPQEKED